MTDKYLIHCIVPEASMLNNDMQRDFRVRKVVAIYPCGHIDRTDFQRTYLSQLRIKDYKVTIGDADLSSSMQDLSKVLQTYYGFIVPLGEIKELLAGHRENWREEGIFLKNRDTGSLVPIKVIQHLENVDEAKGAIEI